MPIHKCHSCNKIFSGSRELRRHNRAEHNPVVERVFCPYPEGIRLDFSESTHTSPTISWRRPNPNWQPCTHSAEVGQETELTLHMLQHLGYRWPCPTCGNANADRAPLSRHEHSWMGRFCSEQRSRQQALLMRGENWLRDSMLPADPPLGFMGHNVPGSHGSFAHGGANVPHALPRRSAPHPAFQPYPSPSSVRLRRSLSSTFYARHPWRTSFTRSSPSHSRDPASVPPPAFWGYSSPFPSDDTPTSILSPTLPGASLPLHIDLDMLSEADTEVTPTNAAPRPDNVLQSDDFDTDSESGV